VPADEPVVDTSAQPAQAPTPPRPRPVAPPAEKPAAPVEAPPSPGPPPAEPDAGEELRPSHPLTSRHARIQHENNLLGALEGALDVRDGAGLRRLLQQYRNEFPEDPNQLQEGYRIIADCLEYPGAETTTAGQKYYDRERGSTLRRFVARYCLGEP
jgi:hypothetical protein